MEACEAANESVIAAKVSATEHRIVAKSFSEILREASEATNRRLLWIMEAMAFIALGCCLALLPLLHGEGTRSAMGIAAGYFTLALLIGAFILLVGKDSPRRS